MRITEQGQVTIPQAIREQAGLMPGTEISIGFSTEAALKNPGCHPIAPPRSAVRSRFRGRKSLYRLSPPGRLLTRHLSRYQTYFPKVGRLTV